MDDVRPGGRGAVQAKAHAIKPKSSKRRSREENGYRYSGKIEKASCLTLQARLDRSAHFGLKQSNKPPFTPTRQCMQASDNAPTVGRKSSGVKLVPRQKNLLTRPVAGAN